MREKTGRFFRKYPLTAMCLVSAVCGFVAVFLWCVSLLLFREASFASFIEFMTEAFFLCGFVGILGGLCLILPILLTVIQVGSLWIELKGREQTVRLRHIDLCTIGLGIICNICLLSVVKGVQFDSDWNVILYNAMKHTPIFTESYPVLWTLILAAVLGYCIVNFSAIEKIPPLSMVLGLAAMYLGTGFSILWTIHVFKGELPDLYLFLLPFCCICITARTVMKKMKEWRKSRQMEQKETGKNSFLKRCNRILYDSGSWPMAAFLFMWPLLGIIIGILVLFGQEPDAVIKAFTETSDWNLSRRVAAQNLYMDEHYLCTVAAGGHERIVKPIRLGIRHGHEVIVNRQLCVANAFEQILEEKTPGFHKVVRGFYDRYGFPIGKLIMKSRLAADVTYYVMKPLEWMFLMVIYLVDAKPENRIAIQYTR